MRTCSRRKLRSVAELGLSRGSVLFVDASRRKQSQNSIGGRARCFRMSGPVRAFHTWISLHVHLEGARRQGGKAGSELTICLCHRSVSSAISAVRCCRLSCTVSRGRASPRAFSTVFFFFAHPPTRVFVFSGALGSSGGGYSAGSGSGERGFVQRVLARARGREKSRG